MAVTTKQLIIQEVEAMSESELAKMLRLLKSFGFTKNKPHIADAAMDQPDWVSKQLSEQEKQQNLRS